MPKQTADISEDLALKVLSERMGEVEYTARLNAERQMLERRGEGQGRGWFRFEHLWDLYGFIRRCLKLTGLWSRAQRNYFNVQVVRNEVVLERLPTAFDGFTILQLSDLHTDLHPDFPIAVRRVIAPLEYDVMALTGDFRTCTFTDHSSATAATLDLLRDVQKPRYAVLGNHDSLVKVPEMEAAGIKFLLNETEVIERGDAALYLVGIDDPNFYQSHNFEHALSGVPEDVCKVLLSHSPQTYDEAAQYGVDFLLAGHTHGGQICLPGGRIIVHDHSTPRRLLSGAWREAQLQGYTSRGTGASGLPVRLNCLPEVTLHVLRCKGLSADPMS
jgi:predicted MPP superfamily phosphohydrolase